MFGFKCQNLRVVNFGVYGAVFHQVGVPALRNDLTPFENKDFIGIDHSTNALRDDKGCAAFHQCIQGFLDLRFGVEVNG